MKIMNKDTMRNTITSSSDFDTTSSFRACVFGARGQVLKFRLWGFGRSGSQAPGSWVNAGWLV